MLTFDLYFQKNQKNNRGQILTFRGFPKKLSIFERGRANILKQPQINKLNDQKNILRNQTQYNNIV